MYVVYRLLPAAVGAMIAALTADAQSEALPPIFAPASERPRPAAPVTAAPSLLSDRSRALVASASSRLLADVKAFDAPSTGTDVAEPTILSDGRTVQMSPFVVKSTVLPRVKAPVLPLYQFRGMGPDDTIDRRMIAGYTATLFRFDDRRTLNLNILQAGGSGVDHGRDFVRIELAFKIRF